MKTMKLFKAIAFMMVFSACSKEKTMEKTQVFNDPNWTRVEIPDGREAHAVYGDLDGTLMVSTFTSIYQTIDKGKTWTKTKENHQPVYGFLSVKDTIFALEANFLKDKSDQRMASYSSSFSLNNGLNWLQADQYKVNKDRKQPLAFISLLNQIIISLKEHLEPISGNANASYVLKNSIEINNLGKTQILNVPFDNQITNLYIDNKGRLYVSATNAIHDKDSGKYIETEDSGAAIIYISKQNINTLISK